MALITAGLETVIGSVCPGNSTTLCRETSGRSCKHSPSGAMPTCAIPLVAVCVSPRYEWWPEQQGRNFRQRHLRSVSF